MRPSQARSTRWAGTSRTFCLAGSRWTGLRPTWPARGPAFLVSSLPPGSWRRVPRVDAGRPATAKCPRFPPLAPPGAPLLAASPLHRQPRAFADDCARRVVEMPFCFHFPPAAHRMSRKSPSSQLNLQPFPRSPAKLLPPRITFVGLPSCRPRRDERAETRNITTRGPRQVVAATTAPLTTGGLAVGASGTTGPTTRHQIEMDRRVDQK